MHSLEKSGRAAERELARVLRRSKKAPRTQRKKNASSFTATAGLGRRTHRSTADGKTFRDFIRVNKDSQRLIKKLIAQVSGVAVPIGPYEPRTAAKHTSNAEQSLHALEKLGLDVSIEDSAKKKYKQ